MARRLPIPNGRLDGALDANGQRIVNLVDPMSGDDAATKGYVDAEKARAEAAERELGLRLDGTPALGETAGTAYPGNKGAANAADIANLKTSKQAALNAQQLAAVNSGITSEKLANLVAKDDVVPVGTGTEVVATIAGKQIRIPKAGVLSSISDNDGNVINADRSVTVPDGTWTCEGVVLRKISGAVWQDDESGYAIGAAVGDAVAGRWLFTPDRGQTFGFCEAPDDAKELTFEVGGRTYSAKFGRSDSLLMTSDVQPRGDGTEVIAVIGGKEIKVPAGAEGAVKSVANVQPTPDGNVPLTAYDIGAVKTSGASVILGEDHPDAPPDEAELVLNGLGVGGGTISLHSGAMAGGASLHVRGYYNGGELVSPASITKDGNEVSTENFVNEKIADIPAVTMTGEYEDGTTFSFNVLTKGE